MKPYNHFRILAAVLFLSIGLNAQSYKLDNESSMLTVDGTSNIHDWTIEAKSKSGKIETEFDDEKLENIESLQFTVKAESLMSGKDGMDKNTYKALDTDKHKYITYNLKNVKSIKEISKDNYKVSTNGDLTISGVKKDVNLIFNMKTANGKLTLNGEYQLNMNDYGIDPPTAMFGTIKTGDMVKIKFTTQFNK